jgi:PEP-CTERM motif
MMRLALLSAGAAAVVAAAAGTAHATTYSYTFTDGGVTASGTLDVTGGTAVAGSGAGTLSVGASFTAPLYVTSLASDYRWGDGTDFFGTDNQVPFDTSGIVFGVGTPYSYGHGIGFTIWSDGGSPASYSYFLAGLDTIGGVVDHFYQGGSEGTLSLSAVPEPATMGLIGSGLLGLGLVRRRRLTV